MTQTTEELLAERRKTHGEFADHAHVTQSLRRVLEASPGWLGLNDMVRETLHMICHKMGRIVTGNPHLHDHYADIAGYAKLIPQRVEDGGAVLEEYQRSPATQALQRYPGQDVYGEIAFHVAYGAPAPAEPAPPPSPLNQGIDVRGCLSWSGTPQRAVTRSGRVFWIDNATMSDGVLISVEGREHRVLASPLPHLPPLCIRWDGRGRVDGPDRFHELDIVSFATATRPSEPMVPRREPPVGPGTPEDGGHHARQDDPGDAQPEPLRLRIEDIGLKFRRRDGEVVLMKNCSETDGICLASFSDGAYRTADGRYAHEGTGHPYGDSMDIVERL